jgi:sulfur carrier protein
MNLTVNGASIEVPAGITVSELLQERKVKMPDMVSVELNGEILERSTFSTKQLKPEDQVEFLYFMGGGRGAH